MHGTVLVRVCSILFSTYEPSGWDRPKIAGRELPGREFDAGGCLLGGTVGAMGAVYIWQQGSTVEP